MEGGGCIHSFMIDGDDCFKFLPVNYSNGARQAQWYMVLKDQCTDIVTEIYPHYHNMYPCGVKEMTGIDYS